MKRTSSKSAWIGILLFTGLFHETCLDPVVASGETASDLRKNYQQVHTTLERSVSRATADQPDSDQRAAIIKKLFKEGRAFYERGDYDSALDQWEKIVPLVPEDRQLSGEMTEFRALWNQSKFLAAGKSPSDQIELFDKIVIDQTVKKIRELLVQARNLLQGQQREAREREVKAKQDLAGKQAFAESAFEQGKSFYAQGKISEALSEWNKLLPYAEDSKSFKALLEDLKKNHELALEAGKAAASAEAENRNAKTAPLVAFDVLLNETNHRLTAQIQDAKAREEKAKASFLAKQDFVPATFEKGNALYNKDKISAAIAEWTKLIPYLDDEELKNSIRTAKASDDLHKQIRRSADDAEAQVNLALFKTPGDLNRLLLDATDKLKTQTRQSEVREAKARAALLTKEAFVRSTLEKGEALYREEKYLDAMMTWNNIVPYLQDSEVIREFETNYIASEKARKSADQAYAAQYKTKFKMPESLKNSLKETTSLLKLQAQHAAAREITARESLGSSMIMGAPLRKGEVEETSRNPSSSQA